MRRGVHRVAKSSAVVEEGVEHAYMEKRHTSSLCSVYILGSVYARPIPRSSNDSD
jgi:hypothetical protein